MYLRYNTTIPIKIQTLRAAVLDEIAKGNEKAAETELQAAAKMTRHRFEQLRDQIDRARDLRQRLGTQNPR